MRCAQPEEEAILSEILALGKIVINLLYGGKARKPLSRKFRFTLAESLADKGQKRFEQGHPQLPVLPGGFSNTTC